MSRPSVLSAAWIQGRVRNGPALCFVLYYSSILTPGGNTMKKPNHLILGIHITERLHHALPVQQVLTEFGNNIKTRLGLHEISDKEIATGGIVLIEFVGNDSRFHEFTQRLNAIDGVEAKQLVFDHP
jgi:hypothetical protein